jgi:WD repeat-containing protein 7
MNSVPLVLPFTLPSSDSALEGSSDVLSCANVLIDRASANTGVSSLTPYWLGSGPASSPSQRFGSSDSLEGVALGCEDGTLFLLRQNRHGTSVPISIEKPLSSRSPSRKSAHRSSRSHSRPRTPTSSLTPFSLASRARVVSAISDEQAKAPKNHVDFDEESEKLRELLKGGAKDSSSTDRPRRSFDRTIPTERRPVQSKGLASPSGPAPRGEGKRLGRTHSPTPSITSLPSSHSAPPSPFCTPYQLSLEFHVFPPRSGPGNAVIGLHALVNCRHLLCLRSQGFDHFLPLPFFVCSFFV